MPDGRRVTPSCDERAERALQTLSAPRKVRVEGQQQAEIEVEEKVQEASHDSHNQGSEQDNEHDGSGELGGDKGEEGIQTAV